MNEDFNKLIVENIPNQQRSNELISKLFTVTQPGVVFSQPVAQGDYTVITASEVSVVMGAGYGGGGGGTPPAEQNGGPTEESRRTGSVGVGSGGGGGGTAMSRPVAVISISSEGVHVEPIVDSTKIALAFFTAIGAIFMSFARMRRLSKAAGRG